MANKHDLKTVFQSLTANTEEHIVIAEVSTVSAVPTGKTRFLTYLRVERTGTASAAGSAITGLTGVIASVATSSNLSSYASGVVAGKLPVVLQALSISACSLGAMAPQAALVNEIPKRPNMEHPIVSVAGGSCMVFHSDAGNPAAQLFAEYYDV